MGKTRKKLGCPACGSMGGGLEATDAMLCDDHGVFDPYRKRVGQDK